MAYPIQPTPVLVDEDAERFYEMIAIWNNTDYQLSVINIPKEVVAECVRQMKEDKIANKTIKQGF